MTTALLLVLAVVLTALVFEYINGFHDTANSIATVVATKVLNPTQAVALAASMNLIGALAGTAVAKTISSGLIDAEVVDVTSQLIICALSGGIVWNLITWWFGLPSSSSHALIGGLIGAALAAAGNNLDVLIWSRVAEDWTKSQGIFWKVIVPMISSPVAGFFLGLPLGQCLLNAETALKALHRGFEGLLHVHGVVDRTHGHGPPKVKFFGIVMPPPATAPCCGCCCCCMFPNPPMPAKTPRPLASEFA